MPRPDYARDAEENREFDEAVKGGTLEDLREGVKVRKREAEEKKLLGERMFDAIEVGAVGTVQWLQQQAEDNPDTWTDDAFRLAGGGLKNAAWALSKIPGLAQLAQAEDWLAAQARGASETVAPWVDPRFAGWGTRFATGLIAEKGIRKATGAITKGVKVSQAISKADEIKAARKIGLQLSYKLDDVAKKPIYKDLAETLAEEGYYVTTSAGKVSSRTNPYLTYGERKGISALPSRDEIKRRFKIGRNPSDWLKPSITEPRNNSSIIRGLSKNFAGPNKLDELNAYINAAEDYRINRLNEAVPKRDLMKGFSWNNDIRGAIFDDENIPWILVRQKRRSIWKGAEAPFADRTNYKLRKLEDVEYDILTRAKSTYSQAGKDLIRLKKELNRLKTNHPDIYYHRLMEYGGEAYIEHKVAKGQRWFWRKKASDSNFAPWSAASRNADENIRLFFNPRFKLLKDNIEKYLEKANPRLWKNDVSNRLVIDIEDPLGIMSGKTVPLAKRSHPGWITIKRAGSGEIVGKIGDYLQDLYHPAFKGMFEEMQSSGGFRKIKDLQGNPLVKPGETFVSFRKRFLSQRVKFILDELDRLNEIPSKADRLKFIDDAIKADTIRFYNQFPEWTPPSILKEFLELPPGQQMHFPLY